MPEDPIGSLERMLERERRARKVAEELAEVHAQALRAAQAKLDRIRQSTSAARPVVIEPAAREAESASIITMSHELRTPMQTILGLTEDLISQAMTAEQRSLLDRVRANAEHMRALLDTFLELSRLDAGSTEIADEPFDPREVIEASVELVAPIAQRKRLELVCDLDDSLPLRARGDARRIGQILANLLGNAIKYTRKGEVQVSARALVHAGEPVLELSVEDTGVGIAKEDLARVFERFVRVGNTQEASGTGLGLALVRSLASQVGGSVAVASVLGVGSTFTARVPLHVLADADAPERTHRYDGVEVAIVLPNAPARSALAKVLGRQGANVAAVARFSDLDQSGAQRFDAILLDLAIPDLSHAVRARSEEPWGGIPLLVLAAIAEDNVAAMKSVSAAGFIVRPAIESRLFPKLDRVLGFAKKESARAQPIPEIGAHASVRPRVLLVEDDPDNRQLLRRTFSRLGYVVTAVQDGELGLARAKAFAFDVIVTDVMMPRRNGPDMASAIRAHEQETSRRPTPIIAITASAFDSTREQCDLAGMNAFLRKPVMTTLLEEALRAHVDHRAAVLSVDDSVETRTLITHFLDAKTARIVHAEGAKQAIERTEQERVDLILMDLEMPGVSGFELAATFRGSQTHVSTPIIAVTGHDDPQIHRRCMDIGFTDILVKPFSRVTLQRIVERHAPRPLVFAAPPTQGQATTVPSPAFGDVAYVDGDVLDLVPQFLENRRADVVRLRDALDAADRETVRRIGHAMRGSGGGYGFDAITRIGGVLEASAIAGDDHAARGGVEELDAYLDRVRVEVRPA